MSRLATFTLAGMVSSAAWAHPGHSTPHLLHAADPWLGWACFVAASALVGVVLARRSS